MFDDAATDLMVLGTVEQGLANGKSVSTKWAARLCVEQGPDGVLKLKSHEIYGVCSPSILHLTSNQVIGDD